MQVGIDLRGCQNEPILGRVEAFVFHNHELTNEAGLVQLIGFALFPLGLDLAELFQGSGKGAGEALPVATKFFNLR